MICGRPDKVSEDQLLYLRKYQVEFGLTYGQMVAWLSRQGVTISKPGLIKAWNRFESLMVKK